MRAQHSHLDQLASRLFIKTASQLNLLTIMPCCIQSSNCMQLVCPHRQSSRYLFKYPKMQLFTGLNRIDRLRIISDNWNATVGLGQFLHMNVLDAPSKFAWKNKLFEFYFQHCKSKIM